ncbi:Ankyrin repeat and sterile alpha motif domain-containing protein 1B [Bagarius yarrelli]|uniref:Ankyrin repeat and sterile alpha motif domain-containing protein 1B n=1 Tax=Bagarius yarrelli TaxID=175774 RepID=A0A556TI79_BAGYA|nr:Ankyrin repeat and sterile alpha motif domain-containing protein 1B [Bagarius yarrelli]
MEQPSMEQKGHGNVPWIVEPGQEAKRGVNTKNPVHKSFVQLSLDGVQYLMCHRFRAEIWWVRPSASFPSLCADWAQIHAFQDLTHYDALSRFNILRELLITLQQDTLFTDVMSDQ